MKNRWNLFLVVLAMFFIGLACSDDEQIKQKSTPRHTPEILNRNENQENSNLNSNLNTANQNMSNVTENITEDKAIAVDRSSFYSVLESVLRKRNLKKSDICDESNPVQKRVLEEYGAIFLTDATPPSACMFTSEEQVLGFQRKVDRRSELIGGATVELQAKAMAALLKAIEEAKSRGLKITPRDGAEAGKRGFGDTLRLWQSRFEPACEHWKMKGKLNDEQISRLKSLPINEQVKEVLELEKQGIYFSTKFDKTILASVAAPGTSQHLSMLAFDVMEFADKNVQKVLGNHGWFRTVKGDAPHFTYLGAAEADLPNMGLHKIETKDGEFWVPRL